MVRKKVKCWCSSGVNEHAGKLCNEDKQAISCVQTSPSSTASSDWHVAWSGNQRRAALLSSQRKNTPTWPSMSPVFARQTSVKKKKSILLCCVPTWLGSYSHTSTLIKSPPLATRGAAARKIDRSCLSLTAPHPALADVYRRNKCQC